MRPLCLRHRNPLASSLFSNSTFIMPARQDELHWTLKYIHKFTGCTQVKFSQIHSLASTFVASAIILAPLQGAGTADSLPVFTVIIAGLRLVRVGSSADSVSVCRHELQRATAKLDGWHLVGRFTTVRREHLKMTKRLLIKVWDILKITKK